MPSSPPATTVRRALWRFALGAVIVVVCAASVTFTVGVTELNDMERILNEGEQLHVEGATAPTPAAGKPRTILLIGSDRRYQDGVLLSGARADTMMLVRLNPKADAVTLLSVPRDLRAEIVLDTKRVDHHRGLPSFSVPSRVVVDKVNAAYALGGAKLTVQTLTNLLGIRVHHVVNVNFSGFRGIVNRIGCVYVDVDRRYFNHNVGTAETNYADIDLQPGYQKLCGADALSYVRFRHTDTDIVRAARQQDFLRQARQQIVLGQLIGDRDELARILARNTQTDIRGSEQILDLLRLGWQVSHKPVRQIPFPATLGGPDDPYVHVDPAALRRAVDAFIRGSVPASQTTHTRPSPTKHRRPAGPVPGIEDASPAGAQAAATVTAHTPFAVLYPRRRLAGSQYPGTGRSYAIRTPDGRLHRAYRLVLTGPQGTYGVQGVAWPQAPILRQPDETRRVRGRTLELHYAGSRLRIVAVRSRNAAWWVSNTLDLKLTNRQMLSIAASLRPASRPRVSR